MWMLAMSLYEGDTKDPVEIFDFEFTAELRELVEPFFESFEDTETYVEIFAEVGVRSSLKFWRRGVLGF